MHKHERELYLNKLTMYSLNMQSNEMRPITYYVLIDYHFSYEQRSDWARQNISFIFISYRFIR